MSKNVNNDMKPRDVSGYGKGASKDKDQGPSPRKKSVADGAFNSQDTDKVNSRNK